MSRQDDIAEKAIRKSTLKSLNEKKRSRIQQLKLDYENSVREVNIQFSENPERLKAKYAAAEYAKNEKARRRAERKIENAKKQIEQEKVLRRFSTAEEITSSIIQGIGLALFIAGTAILDTIAVRDLQSYFNTTVVFYSLFGSSMIFMYLFSLLSHALTNFIAKNVFNRLSHIWSFLIIGFCYSVYTITKIQGIIGWTIFGIVWLLVLVGILFYAISGQKFRRLNIVLYCIAGFSGIVVIRNLYLILSAKSFLMLILGGIFYLVGVVFYNLRKIKFMHTIGNLIMLFGSIYIFFALFFINA